MSRMLKTLMASALLVLPSCSVVSKGGNQVQVSGPELPEHLFVTENRKFLVRFESQIPKPNEENTQEYEILTGDLRPIFDEGYTVELQHWMPTMKDMEIEPAVVERLSGSRVSVTFDIAHGGPWQFILKISRDGQLVDQLVYNVEIPHAE